MHLFRVNKRRSYDRKITKKTRMNFTEKSVNFTEKRNFTGKKCKFYRKKCK